MNRILCLALSVATLSLIAAPPAQARRSGAHEAASTLENEAGKLRNNYKEHLKDIRHWKPRGREEHLYTSMEKLEKAADNLTKELSRGWSRQAERAYGFTMGFAAEVARGIHQVRDRKVRNKWEDVESSIHRLARHVSGGRGRSDGRGFRRGYGEGGRHDDRDGRRGYDGRGSYDDGDRGQTTRTIRFW